MSKADTKTEPMDPTARENAVGAPRQNNRRICGAIKTLVAEVLDMFPETPVEYSNYDGHNAALDVTFDLSVMDAGDVYDFTGLMTLFDFDADRRVDQVIREDDRLLVSMRPNARTKDLREPFGLAEAMAVLTEDADTLDTDTDGGDASSDAPDFVNGGGA